MRRLRSSTKTPPREVGEGMHAGTAVQGCTLGQVPLPYIPIATIRIVVACTTTIYLLYK